MATHSWQGLPIQPLRSCGNRFQSMFLYLESWIGYLGAALCGVVAAQAVFGGYGIWRDRQKERNQSDADAESYRKEVQAAVVAARARLTAGLGWVGRRQLKVAAIVDEAVGVKSFYLTAIDGAPLPPYLPGQYLTVIAPVSSDSKPLLRCYSLSDRPRGEMYRITVKRDGGPTDAEPAKPYGAVSSWLHSSLRVGDELTCESPRGAFFYDPSTDKPIVLIGAGVGATPIMSMLATIDGRGHRQPVYGFLTFRDGKQHLFREATQAIEGQNPSLRMVTAYTKPRDEDRLGQDYQYHGRITIDAMRRLLPSNNFNFYLCGPGRMMQELVPELLDWGVPEEAIHYEAFGPATVTKPEDAAAAKKAIGSLIRFAEDLPPITWDGNYSSILEMAEANNVPIASGCRVGNCGACRIRVVEGSTTEIKKPGISLGKGECLACISQPNGQLVLEA